MSWKVISRSSSGNGMVTIDVFDEVYRATLTSNPAETGTNEHQAKQRLADKLAKLVDELRSKR